MNKVIDLFTNERVKGVICCSIVLGVSVCVFTNAVSAGFMQGKIISVIPILPWIMLILILDKTDVPIGPALVTQTICRSFVYGVWVVSSDLRGPRFTFRLFCAVFLRSKT